MVAKEYKEPDELEILGKRIRDARKKMGYTQEQLARLVLLGRSGRTLISKLERGKANVKFLVLSDIAYRPNRDIAYFTVGLPTHVDGREKAPDPGPLL